MAPAGALTPLHQQDYIHIQLWLLVLAPTTSHSPIPILCVLLLILRLETPPRQILWLHSYHDAQSPGAWCPRKQYSYGIPDPGFLSCCHLPPA